ncbi:trypsin-like serine protease [Shimia sp. SDUM112013]|uniref:trypsin-like serine peptidase n=1 Tax=Shimia sp. SDUM112013 TaxID=3136160 RepID=UPI0032EA9716
MRLGLVLPILLCLLPTMPAFAGDSLKALRSRGDLLGWEAIGRVDMAGHGFCTGSLIAQDLVLTAAHCMFDETGRQIAPERVIFRAGNVSGDALSVRKVNRIVVDSGYVPVSGSEIDGDRMRHDLALLRLASPIFASEADPFRIHATPEQGEVVSVLSYGKGRSENLSWQKDCRVLKRGAGLMSFDCDVTFGSSGAPVFVRYGTRMRILSVISAMGQDPQTGRQIALGMTLPEKVSRLKQRMRNGEPSRLQAGQGAKRITAGAGVRSGGGAKFIKVD